MIKHDAEWLHYLKEYTVLQNATFLSRVIVMFAYYSCWILNYSFKVHSLLLPKKISLRRQFNSSMAWRKMWEKINCGCDQWISALYCKNFSLAVLTQAERSVVFLSGSWTPGEYKHSAVKNVTRAIIEAVHNWMYYLSGRNFTFMINQKSLEQNEKW